MKSLIQRGHFRPTFERLVWIARTFREGGEINCTIISSRWEVCTKTAQRDLEFLRDRLGYDLEYDRVNHVYRLINEPEPLI